MPAEAAVARPAQLGMWVFLAGEALMFGALFMALAVCRWLNPAAWRDMSAQLHLWLGTANTALLLTSSLTMALAVEAARQGRRAGPLLLATALLGLAFLGVKGTEYLLEIRDGLFPGKLPMQMYFLATFLHGLHLAVGCAATLWLALRRSAVAVELVGLYWHFVDVVWVFLFPLFYLAAPR